MVSRAIDYIHAGDIFQANLSQRFEARLPEGWSGFDLYRQLRRINPAPFAAYLKFADSSSRSLNRLILCFQTP